MLHPVNSHFRGISLEFGPNPGEILFHVSSLHKIVKCVEIFNLHDVIVNKQMDSV